LGIPTFVEFSLVSVSKSVLMSQLSFSRLAAMLGYVFSLLDGGKWVDSNFQEGDWTLFWVRISGNSLDLFRAT